MPKKRPYKPKVKGAYHPFIPMLSRCYQCSQRRIHCDRGTPVCQKCRSRNLDCSGLGVRHRFHTGVASRGHWAGKTMQSVFQE
ncbi:unnamed protein product [Clonostachys rosea]|uniref:Zn(2)-C6 fungal-type domain-containing protein n=1 Tax=Bionectria ochroleuca TaxID=29856 RepID=A0ABY6UL33_BIOOC|nr:unnamed protein product [Clonostachys rosea]